MLVIGGEDTQQEIISLPGLRAVRRRQEVSTQMIREQMEIGVHDLWLATYHPEKCGLAVETAEALADVLDVNLWELEASS